MYKFCIISKDCDGLSLAHRLTAEGNEVVFWNSSASEDENGTGFKFRRVNKRKMSMDSITKKCKGWHFLFDTDNWGKFQDKLRSSGESVTGSNTFGSDIEADRMYGINIAKELGIQIPETVEVKSIDDAIKFLKKNPGKWILKQTGDMPKTLNWKASLDDCEDMIDHLITMKEKYGEKVNGNMVLQKVVEGIEVACSGWYNKTGWIKQNGKVLLEVNFENKKLLEGESGVTVGEMGTVAYFTTEKNVIFEECLKPIEKYLKGSTVCVDANCIVNDKGVYLLEWTIRFGYPILDLDIEMCNTDLGKFFNMLAEGKTDGYDFDLENKGIVLLLAFPTFPYENVKNEEDSFKGEVLNISQLSDADMEHVHFHDINLEGKKLKISTGFGYALTVTAKDKDLDKANEKALKIIDKIIPSKSGYKRRDIAESSSKRMKEAGKYLKVN